VAVTAAKQNEFQTTSAAARRTCGSSTPISI
jgi:hypothetical protein